MTDSSAEPIVSYRRAARSPRRQKTAMAVAQRIVDEISRHRYAPGTKLPAEREMLVQYEVGRGTLRESLRFLEMNGVLTVKPGPGGGPVVAAPDSYDLASTLGLFLELHGTRFSAILEVREVLEPALAGMAASLRDPGVTAGIGASVEAMAANLQDLDLFLAENERFHELIAAAAANPVFTLLTGSLDRIIDGSRLGIQYPLGRRQAVLTAHRAIYVAVAEGDAQKARDEMMRHLQGFRRYTDTYYPQAASSVLRWGDIAP
jgi:GntR family transcriptional regulator, transcriptional repressor for pyruvate dehydrogenase complex